MKHLIIITTIALCFSACKKENKVPVNEEELITTIQLQLTDTLGVSHTFTWSDIDGVGGNNPDIDTIFLSKNMDYTATIELLNESVNPIESITEEIEEEATDHQLFYSSSPTSVFYYNDEDVNGNPIGLAFSLSTGNTTTNNGSLTITLRHEPNKFGSNVSNGDISNANGETDLEISFPLVIED